MFKNLPKDSKLLHLLAIILAYVIWSAAVSVIKVTLADVPPYTFLLLRFIIVGVVLLPHTILMLKRSKIHRDDYFKVALLGIFSQTSLILIFLGLQYTTAIEATVIGLLGPILSVAVGHYLYNEKTDWHVKLGLLMASIGTIFVAIEPILESNQMSADLSLRLLGNLLIIAYSLAFLLYIIWSKITMGQSSKNVKKTLKLLHIKPMKKHYSPILLMSLSFYVGLLSFIPMALLEQSGTFGPVYFSFQEVSLVAWAGIVYMAILSSIVAYFAFEWGLQKVEVKETAIFSYLQPVFALPFAFMLLGELPTPTVIAGALVIALGVLIAEYQKS